MSKKILIIDDEPDFVDMIQMRLEANGYTIVSAEDGIQGVDVAIEEAPDLILLDVMMPGWDGYETLKQLRRKPEVAKTPVIMLTAKGESRSIFKAQEMGSTDYLIKPCDSTELLETVAKYA
jgi:two-component system alkaline phosphatase synthesis response regulator PhoP